MIKIFTIGFTKKSAEQFFEQLRTAEVQRLIDIRINNVSQLAGFTKKRDLEYFLKNILSIDYHHLVDLAPTEEILKAYRKKDVDWIAYEEQFTDLISERAIETLVTPALMDGGCLLCSEEKPQHCHRRLVAEYLQRKWEDVRIIHL